MELKHHKTLTSDRWHDFTLAEQFGNIGSEVNRTILAKKRGDQNLLKSAFERALELFDLTIMHKKHSKRLREIGRLREVFIDAFLGGMVYGSDLQSINKYLFDFALVAKR